jgi:predicted hydrocarbon binding protein
MDVLTVLQEIGKNGGKETVKNGIKRYEDEHTAIEFGKPKIYRNGDIDSGIKIIFKVKLPELSNVAHEKELYKK